MSDIKNFGIKGVGDNVQLGKRGPKVKKSGNDVQIRNAGDSAFANIGVAEPTAAEHAATKNYVDTTSAQDVLYRQVDIVYTDTTVNIGAVLPATAKVQQVKVEVTTAWDALLTTLVVDNTATTFMSSTENDLFEVGTYVSDRLGSSVVGANTQLRAVLSGGAPTQGAATVWVSYTKG